MPSLLKWLIRIRNYERIPKLPRGMLASAYDSVPEPARRAMARMGIRDVAGLKVAMRRAGVDNVDDLVANLAHHRAQRRIGRKLMLALTRMLGAVDYVPHRREILDAARRASSAPHTEILARMKRAKDMLND
jgi:hypothetical protein